MRNSSNQGSSRHLEFYKDQQQAPFIYVPEEARPRPQKRVSSTRQSKFGVSGTTVLTPAEPRLRVNNLGFKEAHTPFLQGL